MRPSSVCFGGAELAFGHKSRQVTFFLLGMILYSTYSLLLLFCRSVRAIHVLGSSLIGIGILLWIALTLIAAKTAVDLIQSGDSMLALVTPVALGIGYVLTYVLFVGFGKRLAAYNRKGVSDRVGPTIDNRD